MSNGLGLTVSILINPRRPVVIKASDVVAKSPGIINEATLIFLNFIDLITASSSP
jgi:hypothetical protein